MWNRLLYSDKIELNVWMEYQMSDQSKIFIRYKLICISKENMVKYFWTGGFCYLKMVKKKIKKGDQI